MTDGGPEAAKLLQDQQERSAQLETYAADLRRMYTELRSHLNHLTVLHEVNTRIASALNPEDVLAGVLDSLTQLVSYQAAAIYLLDVDVEVPAAGPHTVVPAATLPRLRALRTFDDNAWPAVEGSVALDDSTVVEAMRGQHTIARLTPTGALGLIVPLKAGGRSLGALELRINEPLGENQIKVIELLAAGAAVALHNAHLYQEIQRLATTDALTNVSNYRHFHELLALEVQRARRLDYPIGLLMLDLDHFKDVNDRHGHPMGDKALRQVADQLRTRLRRTDVVGRVGGEEFGAILPGDNLNEVAIVAETLRDVVEQLPPLRSGSPITETRLTVSIGGTSFASGVLSAEKLMSCADMALYEAKRNGRNQVRLWEEPPAPSTRTDRPARGGAFDR